MTRGVQSRTYLSLDEFRLLRDLIYEHAGLHFDEDAQFLFERRLSERVEALGLDSFHTYYKYLRFNALGPAELGVLAAYLAAPRETRLFITPAAAADKK